MWLEITTRRVFRGQQVKTESNRLNDFSISTEGLSQALQRSASALKTAGNGLSESIAMATAANSVVQDPQQVGAALRTISLRLTGQKQVLQESGEEIEGYVGTVSKMKKAIQNATKVKSNNFMGVDIEDANGNLRSTFAILTDISRIWDEIGEQDKINGTNQQNFLLEQMAGKILARVGTITRLRTYLIAGKPLEPHTTIAEKSRYDGRTTCGLGNQHGNTLTLSRDHLAAKSRVDLHRLSPCRVVTLE